MPDRVVSHTSSELKHRMPLALVALVFQLQRLEHPGRVRLFSLRSVGSARALGLVGVASCNLPLEHIQPCMTWITFAVALASARSTLSCASFLTT